MTLIRCVLRPLCLAAPLALTGAAGATDLGTFTLFGQPYSVQRLDYSAVQWPNPRPGSPTATIGLFGLEGSTYTGGNKLALCTSQYDELYSFGEAWKNVVVEARVDFDGQGKATGISYVRTLVLNDFLDADLDGIDGPAGAWDLSPGGVTINPTSVGLGAGGNLVVADSEFESLRGFPYLSPSNCPIEFPVGCRGASCSSPNGWGVGCGAPLRPNNQNLEDVAFIAAGVSGNPELWTLWQDSPYWMSRFSLTGGFLGIFPIAGNGKPLGSVRGEPKGLFWADTAQNPAAFPASWRIAGGVAVVALDDNGPALQAYDRLGNEIGYQPLVSPGPNGTFDLPGGGGFDDVWFFGDSSAYLRRLQFEAIAVDSATGRIFLFNQGTALPGILPSDPAVFFDNFVYVLSPIVAATPPGGFTLTAPAGNQLIASLPVPASRTPSFSWTTSAGASSYTVEITGESDTGFASPIVSQVGLTGTSWSSTTPLDFGTKYRARVRAVNAGGATTATPAAVVFGIKCQSDVDNNGAVGANDLSVLLGAFGQNCVCPADVDGNGSVGANDLSILLGQFGGCSITLP
ncbi:MAG: hypothetical protein IBJ11_08175 [Phycisphaerales bacterium]|nr:hypothetical protein [Phycisphaerales bacterium]